MATCSPSELLAAANCFNCLSPKQIELAKLVLLCRILQAHDAMATCNVNELLEDAKCFVGLGPKEQSAVQIQLLCEILNSGGTGSTCIVCLDDSDEPVDAAPCDCSIAYNTDGRFWFWNSITASWIPFIV